MNKILRLKQVLAAGLLTAVCTTGAWALDPISYDEESHEGPWPWINCGQFEGMDFWLWAEWTYRWSNTIWPGPDPNDPYGKPAQYAFEQTTHDVRIWAPRRKSCHEPSTFLDCNPAKARRGMNLKQKDLLPPYERKWVVWGGFDEVPGWGWVPYWISRSGTFFSLISPKWGLDILYQGSMLDGVNDPAPGLEPAKPAGTWGTEWLSPGFEIPYDAYGVLQNPDDVFAICNAFVDDDDDSDSDSDSDD